jgi:hypothetical protein
MKDPSFACMPKKSFARSSARKRQRTVSTPHARESGSCSYRDFQKYAKRASELSVLPRSRVSGASGKRSAGRIASIRLVAGRPSCMCSCFCFGRRMLFPSSLARCQLTGRSESAQEVAREVVKQFGMLNGHVTLHKAQTTKQACSSFSHVRIVKSWHHDHGIECPYATDLQKIT